MGTKKILGCLAKFWVNGPCFIENLTIFLSFYDLVNFKKSKIIWKVKTFNFFIFICINMDYYDLWKISPFLTWPQTHEHQKFCIFLINNINLLKILPNNRILFLFPKFLELFFTPVKTPPKFKNSKLNKRCIFWGTPKNLFFERVSAI